MHWINTTSNTLTVKSYPLALVSLVAFIMLLGTLGIIFKDHQLEIVDGLIFYGVCIGFMSFHKYKKTVFDKKSNKCSLVEKNLFTQKENEVSLSDIETYKMSHGGGGNYARGGVLYMRVKGDTEFHIIDSDIQLNHEQKTRRAKEQIESFV